MSLCAIDRNAPLMPSVDGDDGWALDDTIKPNERSRLYTAWADTDAVPDNTKVETSNRRQPATKGIRKDPRIW